MNDPDKVYLLPDLIVTEYDDGTITLGGYDVWFDLEEILEALYRAYPKQYMEITKKDG